MMKNERFENTEQKPDVIAGRNPVSEAVRSNRPIDKILVAKGEKSGAIVGILAKARDKKIPVKEVDRTKLDYVSGGATHQGIVAFAAAKDYSTVDDILEYAESKGEAPFVVVLDEVEDPHNLGAIIRTAECAGVHGIIIPKRRSAGLSYTVAKASAGAIEYMRVARVTNIAVTLDELKEKGVWIYGADMDGTDYPEQKNIPFFFWYSDLFAEKHGDIVAALKHASTSGKIFTHDYLYHTVIALGGIRSKAVEPQLDITGLGTLD